ncbi:MAG: hypothetical protein IT337_15305 [Thermomicrobiales bacterium]|nr:hypothetical protein [Thermomicrobiales bacterium]
MAFDPRDVSTIPLGTPVIAFDGNPLGRVRETHPHYLLVAPEGQHDAFEVPVQSILSFTDGRLQVHVNPWSSSTVDDEETAHRLDEEHP